PIRVFDANGQSTGDTIGRFIIGSGDWRSARHDSLWRLADGTKTVNDPCPQGWRIPTADELSALRLAGSTWTTNWNGTGVRGRVFGTAPNTLFLPAASVRESNGVVAYEVASGHYWTTREDVNRYYAWRLIFGSGNVYLSVTYRAWGHSVRCVTLCPPTFGTLDLDSCDQITYNGIVFFKDTTFTEILVNAAGCDSLLTVNLSMRRTFGTLDLDSCDQITYNGIVFIKDTTFTDTLVNTVGCDSLLTVNLTVRHKTFGTLDLDSCDQITYNSMVFFKDTTFTDTLVNAAGCDSLLTVNLTVRHKTFGTLNLDSCDQITYNEMVFIKDTTFTDTLVNTAGCDSLLTVNLIVRHKTFGTLELDSCDQITYNGMVFFKDTVFTEILVNAAGCDSLLTVNLSMRRTFGTLELDSCDQITYNDIVFIKDTIFTDTLVNAAGCDSLLTVNLTVRQKTFGILELDSCDQIMYNGTTFFNDTTFIDILTNTEGCDSLLTVNIIIHRSYFEQQNLSGMDSVEFLSKYYYRDTVLTHAYQTDQGCDSVVETHIFVSRTPREIEAEIIVYWHRILAVPNWHNLDELRYATYYWYKDDALLPQSNKDHIEVGTPIPAGKYNVSVQYGGREILYLERIFDRPFGISAYPNPLHIAEEFTIESTGKAIKRVEVFDVNGVLQQMPIRIGTGVGAYCIRPANNCDQCQRGVCNTPLRVSGFKNPGMYILKIYFNDHAVETLKIIVK
ncbi:MAG: hypothetical protein FWG79_06065, partial [Bacteroidales bacterium]|nr:hypothetical protein [Bacteroidales bacterium]